MSGHERERLSAYLDRQLPPDERLMVEAHLAGCAGCTALLAELAAADEAAAALPAEAPAGYFESFPARVRSRLGPRKAQAPARRLPAWTWAAAAGLLLAIVVPLTLRQLPPTAREAPPTAPSALPRASQGPLKAAPAPDARPPGSPPTTARGARPGPPTERKPAATRVPAPAAPADEARAEAFFAPEPGAPPPGPGLAAPAPRADAESDAAAADRAKGARERMPSVAAKATAEDAPPAFSATSAGRAAGSAGVGDHEGAFRRLDAVRPRSAAEWRRLRDEWSAFAAAETNPLRADEARIRAVLAAREAWRAGGDESDGDAFRRAAAAYLQREDALQKPRVERLLAEPPRTP